MKVRVITIIAVAILIIVGVVVTIFNIDSKQENNENTSDIINQNVINATNENANISSENNSIVETQTKEETFVFEGKVPNLPNQIILKVNEKQTIVDGRRINLMLQELEVDTTKIKETVYSGGAIYTRYGNMLYGINFDEKLESYTSSNLILTDINFEAGGDFGISIMGIDENSTINDVLGILGTPNYNSDTYPINDYKKGYLLKWNDVKIDKFTLDISAIFYKDGEFKSLSIDVK